MTTCIYDYHHEDLVDCGRAKPLQMSMTAGVLRCVHNQRILFIQCCPTYGRYSLLRPGEWLDPVPVGRKRACEPIDSLRCRRRPRTIPRKVSTRTVLAMMAALSVPPSRGRR